MDIDAGQEMAKVAGIIVAASLVLSQVLGGVLAYLVESIKATGKVKDGWSGLLTLIMGTGLGILLAVTTDLLADNSPGIAQMVALGAFAGLLMSAGAIKTYKAMGEMNPTQIVEVEPVAEVRPLTQAERYEAIRQ